MEDTPYEEGYRDMANQIKMAGIEVIYRLFDQGWSRRRIARELGFDRETVRRHLRLRAVEGSGGVPSSEGGSASKPANSPPGTDPSKPAISPAGIFGRQSACRAYEGPIRQGVESGLSAQRIFQDLRTEQGFTGSYDSVKRYVRRLRAGQPERVERMECLPGDEAQVDFGLGAPILFEGRRRRSWVLRVVLSHSRKGYSEAVYRQGTEEFLRALENAFRAFGGVPKTLVIDNLRAAVARVDWYDPELTPKVREFCRHYGTVMLPTRPRHPEHKGKVERGIGYVKSNALKGRTFSSLSEENEYLRWWEGQVADQRIHGTTREHVGRVFAERERAALQPLPPMPFPSFQEAQRCVHRDGHVEVKQAYYEVPQEYIGRQVWVRFDGRLVHVFNLRMQPLVTHVKLEPGQFSQAQTDPRGRRRGVERTAEHWCRRAQQLGPCCGQWAERVHRARGIEAIRVLMGLEQLAKRVGCPALEQACARALAHDALRLRDLRRLLEEHPGPEQLSFLDTHPLIRDLSEYGKLLALPVGESPGCSPELPTAAPTGFVGPFGASMDNSSPAPAQPQRTNKEEKTR